jgi:hypothetical protein
MEWSRRSISARTGREKRSRHLPNEGQDALNIYLTSPHASSTPREPSIAKDVAQFITSLNCKSTESDIIKVIVIRTKMAMADHPEASTDNIRTALETISDLVGSAGPTGAYLATLTAVSLRLLERVEQLEKAKP